jgi:hypothetical protein
MPLATPVSDRFRVVDNECGAADVGVGDAHPVAADGDRRRRVHRVASEEVTALGTVGDLHVGTRGSEQHEATVRRHVEQPGLTGPRRAAGRSDVEDVARDRDR